MVRAGSRRTIVASALAVLLLAVIAALLGADTARGAASATAFEGVVVGIVDGDTIHVRLGDRVERVRYIGIDAPEILPRRPNVESAGRDASRVNRELVAGRRVRLELDLQPRDRHGRLLAYVWVGDMMVNEEIVRRGYAQVLTVPPNVRYQHMFLAREREARQHGRGLWRSG